MISCYQLTVPGTERSGPVFDEVSFEIDEGEWVEFVGPSGAGKSVLYAILALEARPDQGRLVVAGRNLSRLDERGLVELRREIGSCRETVDLLNRRTVVENLVVPLVVRDKAVRAMDAAKRLLDRANLADLRDAAAAGLARGERRLVGVLRATIGRPRAILVDGGLEGLEGEQFEAAAEALRRSHEQGSAVYLFSRNPTECAPDERTVFRLGGATVQRGER